MKIIMKSSVWILISLLFSGHTSEGYSVQYDGDHESGRDVVQTRNTRYVDSASGSWNTNIGYTSSKRNEGGVLGGLLDTMSSISSGIGSSAAGKSEGNDQVNAKGAFQIKVDANAAGIRPTAILGGVLHSAASAIGSLSDIAKKNFESRRSFQGSLALEGNSYMGANGRHFGGQEEIIGTNGHDATTNTKTLTITSQSQITSNSGANNGFEIEGRRKDSGFAERQLSENLGTNGRIANGQSEDNIAEQNLKTLQKEVTITSSPSITTGESSSFGSTGHASANFRSQLSRGEDGSYSVHPEDHVTISETAEDSDIIESESEKSEELQDYSSKGGRTPAKQFSRNLEYENESSNVRGNGRISANIGSSSLTSTILKDVRVTTNTQEGVQNIQNLKTASQTSSLQSSTSSNGNLHDHSHVNDYNESDESIEIKDHSATLQKQVAAENGQNILANVKFNNEETTNLGSQFSGIELTTDYDSSSESDEMDGRYLRVSEGKLSETHLQPSGYNREQIESFEHDHGNSGKYQNENVGTETVQVTRHTSEAGSVQNKLHPTLVDFRPNTDYDSEEIEDNGSKIIRTVSVTSQINQAKPTVEFQKGVTGDYLNNLRQKQTSGYEKSYSESRLSNDGKDLGIAFETVQNSRNRGDLRYLSNLQNQENLSGRKILQSEISTSTHANDDEDISKYNTGYSSSSNGRSSYNKDLGIVNEKLQNSQNRGDLQFSSNLQNQDNLSESKIVQTKVSTTTRVNDDAEDDEDINETGQSFYLSQGNSYQKIGSNGRSSYNKANDDNSEIRKHSLTAVENGASSTSYVNGNQDFNSHISGHLDGEYSDNSGLHEKDTEYKQTESAQNELRSLGKSFISNSRKLFSEQTKPELELENNYGSGVTITSSNPQNVGLMSDFALTAGRSQNSRFHAGQGARNEDDEETLNRRLIEGQEVIINPEGIPQSSFTFESEARRRPISSSRKGQYFESRGEVVHTGLENVQPIVHPILGYKDQNPRSFSNYGKGSEYLRVIGGGSHIAPVPPGTKVVRKEVTETVHTSGGPPHVNQFDHREIHRASLGNHLRRNFNEGFRPISEPDSSEFLSTDPQLHELHHGHGHDIGHSSSNRYERRLLDRRGSQHGFFGSFDEPLIDPHVEVFGPEGPSGHSEFHKFHNALITYPGDDHEGGRIGFRKIVKVTHEVEDVPRHGRQIEFGQGHYY